MERRQAAGVLQIDRAALLKQQTCELGCAKLRRRLQRRPLLPGQREVDVGPALDQHACHLYQLLLFAVVHVLPIRERADEEQRRLAELVQRHLDRLALLAHLRAELENRAKDLWNAIAHGVVQGRQVAALQICCPRVAAQLLAAIEGVRDAM
eukprot:6178676-Pleurochrysis_carterae.AAC.1